MRSTRYLIEIGGVHRSPFNSWFNDIFDLVLIFPSDFQKPVNEDSSNRILHNIQMLWLLLEKISDIFIVDFIKRNTNLGFYVALCSDLVEQGSHCHCDEALLFASGGGEPTCTQISEHGVGFASSSHAIDEDRGVESHHDILNWHQHGGVENLLVAHCGSEHLFISVDLLTFICSVVRRYYLDFFRRNYP